MAKTTVKLNKKEIDKKVLEFLKVDEEIKVLQNKLKTLKVELENQYNLGPSEKEIIRGNETIIEKIPVNNGKNNYNVELLKPFLKAIRKFNSVIKKVEIVDIKALDELIKTGQLAPEILDTCREDKWTFKSTFKRIEAVTQDNKKASKNKVS